MARKVIYKIYIISDKEVIVPNDNYHDIHYQYTGEYVKILKEYISENGLHEVYSSFEEALLATDNINKEFQLTILPVII